MYRNSFSVRVPEGTEEADGYVVLKHGQEFSIMLRNDTNDRCDAEIVLDGKNIGVFRLEPKSGWPIERPSEDNGKFVFFKKGTSEYEKIEGAATPSDLSGLLSVTFRTEKRCSREYVPYKPLYDYHDWQYCEIEDSSYPRVTYPRQTLTIHPAGVDTTCFYSATSSSLNYSNNTVDCNTKSLFRGVSGGSDKYKSGGVGLQGESSQKFVEASRIEYDESTSFTINLRLVAKEREDPRPLRPSGHRGTPIPPPIFLL